MFQNDYLMRLILQFVRALQRALREQNVTPQEKIESLRAVVGDAVNIDAEFLLSMDPQSLVSVLQLGDFDDQVGEYVLRTMYLEAKLLDETGNKASADLRRSQADAIARAYDLDVSTQDVNEPILEEWLEAQETLSAEPIETNRL